MQTSKRELTKRRVELLERFYVEVRCRPGEDWSDIELTIPQLRTLVLLRSEDRRMTQIADYLGTSLPSATSMIDRLFDKGLVERMADEHDRRVVACRLTAQGTEEVERFWQLEQLSMIRLADQLDADELGTVVKAMELLLQAAKRAQAVHVDGPDRGERSES